MSERNLGRTVVDQRGLNVWGAGLCTCGGSLGLGGETGVIVSGRAAESGAGRRERASEGRRVTSSSRGHGGRQGRGIGWIGDRDALARGRPRGGTWRHRRGATFKVRVTCRRRVRAE